MGSLDLNGERQYRTSAVVTNLTIADSASKFSEDKKSAGENNLRRIFICRAKSEAPYAFMLAFTASAVIGNERTRAPQALKIALPSAGAITVTAGSPTPVAFSPLAMTLTATSGICDIRNGV